MIPSLINTALFLMTSSCIELQDGLPKLVGDVSVSDGYAPPEKSHAQSLRVVHDEKFYRLEVPSEVRNYGSRVWGDTKVNKLSTGPTFTYRSEEDVVKLVDLYLSDIIMAAKLQLQLSGEVGIKHIRPDLIAIYEGKYLVGVVEVKKPGENILTQPTVLGELLDQMLLVEGFYRLGPVVGILTSGTEWMVAWLPDDAEAFLSPQSVTKGPADFNTPMKSTASGPASDSPPGTTPSQQKPQSHAVGEDESTSIFIAESDAPDDGSKRTVHTTKVVSSETDRDGVLSLLYTAVVRMTQIRIGYRRGKCSIVFKVLKDQTAMRWCCIDPEEFVKGVDFDKFPRSDTKSLLMLEDLGRGASGKVWLSATKTAVCVLKYSNRDDKEALDTEANHWGSIYPQFEKCTAVEIWSGTFALRMAHFSTIAEERRSDFANAIEELLRKSFQEKGYIHSDVRWRNLGIHKTDGIEVPVLYDLDAVEKYDEAEHGDWVKKAMSKLFPVGIQDVQDAVNRMTKLNTGTG